MARSIQGQLLRRSERREEAIFLRDGTLWVADIIDGQGQLIDAATWFRFNRGVLSTSRARHRVAYESTLPLPEALAAKIESLPRPAAPRRGAGLNRLIMDFAARLPRSPLAAMLAGRFRPRRAQQVDATVN
jgi:hypothetical protein